ncbi:MAG: DUF6268 family outer membrane beta-barrel protein [Pirellulales bacterium]|nr:DUF6268 family outer membrane beta-barrel protein [Pirellulales bacterium]
MLKQHSISSRFTVASFVLMWLVLPLISQAQTDRIPSPITGSPPPTATFEGGIQPLPGSGAWDPYGPAATQTQSLPQVVQPGTVPPQPGGTVFGQEQFQIGEVTQFLQQIGARNTWIWALDGDRGLGVNDIETSATFAFPFRFFTQQAAVNQAPLLVTPGFTLHLWDGPDQTPVMMEPTADMPPQTYDAYLDTAWQPEFNPQFAADLAVRVGIYSDFEKINSRSLRVTGRGLGVYTLNPRMRIAAGVVYLDRQKIKLLPAGGLIWTPDEDTRYHILFPNPKMAKRLPWRHFGSADVWWYVLGEYGGGSWTVERDDRMSDVVDYNDIRVLLGLEWETPGGFKGDVAIGFVWDRELLYRSNEPASFKPSDTGLLRAGFSF